MQNEKILNQYFENIVIPQMLEEKDHSRKGGFYLRCEDGDYLKILYTWERNGVYEGIKLSERT